MKNHSGVGARARCLLRAALALCALGACAPAPGESDGGPDARDDASARDDGAPRDVASVPERDANTVPDSGAPPRDAATPADGGAPALRPSPLISRGVTVAAHTGASTGRAGAVNDGVYATLDTWNAGRPTARDPAWVALRVGGGRARVLLSWSALGSYRDAGATSPGAYRVEVSGDSTDGASGRWTAVATVEANTVSRRAHSFDFAGMVWVRLVVTAPPAGNAGDVQLDEVDVHDLSAVATGRPDDTWFFMGDSVTALGYDRGAAHAPSFAAAVHARHGGYDPAMLNGGIGGENSGDGVAHVAEWLALNPDARFFAIGYGTNDSWGNWADTAVFRANMQTVIDRVRAAGRVPILARIPFGADGNHATVPAFNRVVDELTAANGLTPGPDLYAWFQAHPGQLYDGVHPDDAGRAAMNALWAEAMDALYPR